MKKPKTSIDTLALTAATVRDSTIKQFEKSKPDTTALYKQLFESNEALALWLRKRAAELAPNIEDREAVVIIALEMMSIANNQLLKNGLTKLWEAPKSSS